MPFAVTDNVDHPVSLYAGDEEANELMALHSHLYRIPHRLASSPSMAVGRAGTWRCTCSRRRFSRGREIDVRYNHGRMQRELQ
jgi:UDP-glucuronate 4-epimerase